MKKIPLTIKLILMFNSISKAKNMLKIQWKIYNKSSNINKNYKRELKIKKKIWNKMLNNNKKINLRNKNLINWNKSIMLNLNLFLTFKIWIRFKICNKKIINKINNNFWFLNIFHFILLTVIFFKIIVILI